ncbi:hypothetical protein G7Y89_g13986 [Cudoniella acicularis]|uniref:Uncharacterized protein n=1 Tax=Cudoniella acicularis TaxID=354080 RepID=A0A8H4R769_9HELO|nr:hypothetical protein G7Y89_g13986 [Cudoniella acicularis]
MAQAQPQRTKPPLDVLQAMLNGILIETGRALKTSTKDGGRALASTNTRLQSTIPSAVETFQQALDELECDILRAKSVLLRDLNELRSKRIALENPVPIVEETTFENAAMTDSSVSESQSTVANQSQQTLQPESNTIIKEEKASRSPENAQPQPKSQPIQDPQKDSIKQVSDAPKGLQVPSPPASSNETSTTSKPVRLGINTATTTDPNASAPATAGAQDSAVDSLFDILDNDESNNGNAGDLNFDGMDFAFDSTTDNQDQTQTQTQTQTTEFDLSTFGTNSQDFSMPNLDTSANTNSGSKTNPSQNKEVDGIFGDISGTAGSDGMDLDLNLGADDSLFNDIFFDDDLSAGGGTVDMEHGNFDSAFFGLDD